jgi:integrase
VTDLKTPASRRVIPLPEFVVLELARHLETYGFGVDGLVFANRRGGIWRRGSFNDSVWKPALRRAGLNEAFGFHALRHTYASGLISENIHPRVIQARLGHESIVETMDTYGHLFPESRQETIQALDRLFGSG